MRFMPSLKRGNNVRQRSKAAGVPQPSQTGDADAMTVHERYASHRWKSERQMTDYGTGYEYFSVCDECGCENRGDPAEFPELDYPACEDDRAASAREAYPEEIERYRRQKEWKQWRRLPWWKRVFRKEPIRQ